MRVRRGVGVDGGHGQARLGQLQAALAGRHQHQHALGARQVDALQQRAGDGLLGGDAGAVRAGGHGRAHHGAAGLAHHRAHVLEVHVDLAVLIDDLGDAAHGVLQHVVGVGEGLFLAHVVAQHLQQLLVEHHDEGVHVGLQLGQALFRVLHLAAAFPLEGLGDHAHGEDAHLLGHTGDHGRSARARAPAHAGGDEQHVGPRDRLAHLLLGLAGRLAGALGLVARPQAVVAQLDGAVRRAAQQLLRVGVGADEFHALHTAGNHVLDGVAAAAAHADHLDVRALVELVGFDHFDAHEGAPVFAL